MNRVFFVTVVVRVLSCLNVDFGVGKYLRNSCHLAAKFGTNFVAFSVYVIFAMGG